MEFTYDSYNNLLKSLKEFGFSIVDYSNWTSCLNKKKAILRHDIDYDLHKAMRLAKIEYDHGVKSTYFILPRSDFYNVFSPQNAKTISEIISLGHDIGLHFDESIDRKNDFKDFRVRVEYEKQILELATNTEIKAISMHRPSKWVLENDLEFDGLINSYSREFFLNWKYVSDSRMSWREDIIKLIASEKYHQLHILTHPFWYHEHERSTEEILRSFIMQGNNVRFNLMNQNFRNLDEYIEASEVNHDECC